MAWGISRGAGVFLLVTLAWAPSCPLAAEPAEATNEQAADRVDVRFQVESPTPETLSGLSTIDRLVDERRWDELFDRIEQLSSRDGERLVMVAPQTAIRLRDALHALIAQTPPDALQRYRERIDTGARDRWQAAISARDTLALEELLDREFCSGFADDALLALADLRLEQGWYGAARWCLDRLAGPIEPQTGQATAPWTVVYPGPDPAAASVAARRVLISILQEELPRAERELKDFHLHYAADSGPLAGRNGPYGETLALLLSEARTWQPRQDRSDWPSYAAGNDRTGRVAAKISGLRIAWTRDIAPSAAAANAQSSGLPAGLSRTSPALGGVRNPSVGPRQAGPRSSSLHPVIWQGLVLVCRPQQVLAFELETGRPALGAADGVIYADEPPQSPRLLDPLRPVGEPRQTATIAHERLYARMGDPFTEAPPRGRTAQRANSLVCLDLKAGGRIAWKLDPESPLWSFDGSPLVEGPNLYVAMRLLGPRPTVHLACFDARSGLLRWRRLIGSADSPYSERQAVATQSLLSSAEGTIYYNTNLGAIAAVETAQGRIRWIHLYERTVDSGQFGGTPCSRTLTPCIADRGRIYTAPADCEHIICLDSSSGRRLWSSPTTGPELDACGSLLGVTGEHLIAAGSQLAWFRVDSGDRVAIWPDQPVAGGAGVGAIAGGVIAWAAGDRLHLLRAAPDTSGGIVQALPSLPLPLRDGGHAAASVGKLVVAGENLLVCLDLGQVPSDASADAFSSKP